MHADGSVHSVVDHDEHHVCAVLHGGGELLTAHQEAAIARKAHGRAVRIQNAGFFPITRST
jgi:hypothetical protein